ncbi:uncharacterized protein LOC128228394 [Mya arenaria]|uniref:uncharacterized protein LOC128228394 n=1 Tax=Mya arenaria TaxID=6604 RepID=UPI0022E259AC|nr:uncharacterized protein LOC128228394 [Mya arenaria]XP_052795652.1 uncharacterized protein LOC128228394 [Mya arenaria]XP_052795653.1 uncharacterized protein LOC128228394 [Mya arenaria]
MSGVTYKDIKKANQFLEDALRTHIVLDRNLESAQKVFPETKGREGYIAATGQEGFLFAKDQEGYVTDIVRGRVQGYRKTPVGRYQNQWQEPITIYGRNNPDWEVKLKASSFVGDIDVDNMDWFESRVVVDLVMDLLQIELRSQAKKYEGLVINWYVRQGSSREGLKVVKADEFDVMLEFHFDGLDDRIKQIYVIDGDKRMFIPGHCYLELRDVTIELLRKNYAKLYKKGVFIEKEGKIFLSSKHLHVQIFESMVDSAVEKMNTEIKIHDILEMKKCKFALKRKMNPPSINLAITFKAAEQVFDIGPLKDKDMDLDFVPAFLLRHDQTTSYEGELLKCPIHAVCKWAEENSLKALEIADQTRIWDVKSTGYEKHILDVAREDERKLYILTALRILKTYFVKTKKYAKESGCAPPQIVTVLKSYHLKQLAFYLLNYLCHKYPHFVVDGVQKALMYFIDAIRVALKEKHLPHLFFSDNNVIETMLPGYPLLPGPKLRFDLFRKIPNDSLIQALFSLEKHLIPNLGFSTGGDSDYHDHERARVHQDFKSTVSGSDYF